MFEKINKAAFLISCLWKRATNKAIFLRYFYTVDNVGDILNVELIEHYTHKKVLYPPLIGKFKHLLAVGSVLDQMTENTIVLGSGLISPQKITNIQQLGDIRALRGELSKKLLEDKFNIELNIKLGDFALLFPKIYNPIVQTEYEFGLVLHYVDENHKIKDLVSKLGGKVISVKQRPHCFIDELVMCKKIISSSMHGLILSDAYNIPNKRIKLSDNVFGGDFKFNDYYSTTDNIDEQGVLVCENPNELDLNNIFESCTVKKYKHNISDMEAIMKELIYV
jgi:pyruvyltransferase